MFLTKQSGNMTCIVFHCRIFADEIARDQDGPKKDTIAPAQHEPALSSTLMCQSSGGRRLRGLK